MRFRILAFGIETKILGKRVQKLSLSGIHRLESQPLLFLVSGKYTELPLIYLAKFSALLIDFQSGGGVWDMVVNVCRWINI